MTDLEARERLAKALTYTVRAMAQLEGVAGMEYTQESLSEICADLEMQIEELDSFIG